MLNFCDKFVLCQSNEIATISVAYIYNSYCNLNNKFKKQGYDHNY